MLLNRGAILKNCVAPLIFALCNDIYYITFIDYALIVFFKSEYFSSLTSKVT